uniref:Uncharacterized protein n=1 Tax=Rhizophora mucronata TaxID=61149 RepID=A0A2P2LD87_RHIMU
MSKTVNRFSPCVLYLAERFQSGLHSWS